MAGIWGNEIITRWIYFRLFGVIELIAFASFGVQAAGLIGKNGIQPAGKYLEAVKKSFGRKGFFFYPTLFWIDSSDRSLVGACLLGAFLSLALILGVQTTPVLLLLWILYLSLVSVGQVFLSYQWDALLLEAGFLSIFLVPPSILPSQALRAPSPWIIFLFRWLLFRLIFMSGVAKLISGDLTWRNLTAMAYHYETQPLPDPLAWYMHKLPALFQKFSTLFSLVIELVPPWLFFIPGLLGWIGGFLSILLQLFILLTGNFAFFNDLMIVLAVFLYDDAVFQKLLPARLLDLAGAGLPAGAPYAWGNIFPILLAVFISITGLLTMLIRFTRDPNLIKTFQPFLQSISSLRLVNAYGLFASMTTLRPEIILEGSDDSQTWKPYKFKYKPGDLHRRPPVVAPHQPRLDWQMWFAALADYRASPWILNLVESLLLGSPEVLKLLAENPFPEKPPHYIRGILYDYHFTTFEEKKRSGDWWKREALGLYLPVVSLK